jgi:hypothetical protein
MDFLRSGIQTRFDKWIFRQGRTLFNKYISIFTSELVYGYLKVEQSQEGDDMIKQIKYLVHTLVGGWRVLALIAGFAIFMGGCLYVVQRLVPPDRAGQVKKGDQAFVPSNMFFTVVNSELIRNDGSVIPFEYGDQCRGSFGARLTVEGRDDHLLLIRYRQEGEQEGIACPDEALFLVKDWWFAEASANYERELRRRQEEQDVVRRLLGKSQ